MDSLIFAPALLLLVALLIGIWLIRRQYRRTRIERIREQARLRIVESQIAALGAALRVSVAEHMARRAMQSRDLFENRTDHEEYRSS